MASNETQKINLVSSDGVTISTGMRASPHRFSLCPMLTCLIERNIAERSMLIKNMIEDLGNPGEEPIPIMNVSIRLDLSQYPSLSTDSLQGLRSRS